MTCLDQLSGTTTMRAGEVEVHLQKYTGEVKCDLLGLLRENASEVQTAVNNDAQLHFGTTCIAVIIIPL